MTNARTLSILLVDDHRDGADSLHQLLQMCGYEAQVVYSASAALAAVNEKMPDVLISDIGMPHLDGCELAMKIASLDDTTPLMIAITGFTHVRDRCRIAGFDFFFVKPAEPADLIGVLQRHWEWLRQSIVV